MSVSFVAVLLTCVCARASVLAAQDSLVERIQALVAPDFRPDRPGGVVLVARNGTPIFRRAYGMADLELGVAMRPDHVFKIASITKQFTAAAVLQLVAQGKVALDADVRAYLPDFDTHGRKLTVEQVLTHTSGLPNLVDLQNFDVLARQDHTPAQLLALTKDTPLHFEPGSGFRYSDTGYILLGAIVERVSGLRYGDYVETRIFRPLGMRDSYYADDERIMPRSVTGYTQRDSTILRAPFISMSVPHAAGGLSSTADDLLRWHLALRAGSVIPRALLERAWQPRVLPDGTKSGYGFGFENCDIAGHRTVEHGGFINGFLANALQLPDDKLDVIVLVNNDADAPDPGMVARRIARLIVTGSPRPTFHSLLPSERAALAGTYQLTQSDRREVFERDGVLYVRRNERPARALVALSPTELTLADSDGAFMLSFELGPGGRAQRVRASLRCEPVDVAIHESQARPQQRDEMTFYQDLAWSPDGSQIAFAAMKVSRARWAKESYGALNAGDFEIYVMNADGTAHRRLTNNPDYDLWLSWSPDSRRIVFGSDRNGNTDLYAMDRGGSHLTRLTSDSAKESGPSWSPDGRRIAYMSKESAHWQLWVMNSDGSERRQLTKDSANHSNPVWSPDGERLAYFGSAVGRDQVFVMRADGGDRPRAIADGVFPAWAPDGRSIIFGNSDKLYLVGLDASPARLLIDKSEFGRISPDGRRIAFVMGEFPDTQVYVMDVNGAGRRQLTR